DLHPGNCAMLNVTRQASRNLSGHFVLHFLLSPLQFSTHRRQVFRLSSSLLYGGRHPDLSKKLCTGGLKAAAFLLHARHQFRQNLPLYGEFSSPARLVCFAHFGLLHFSVTKQISRRGHVFRLFPYTENKPPIFQESLHQWFQSHSLPLAATLGLKPLENRFRQLKSVLGCRQCRQSGWLRRTRQRIRTPPPIRA